MERSCDGRVAEVILQDRTRIVTFRERVQIGGQPATETQVYLVYTEEGSVIKMTEDGEVVIVSSTDRVALNEKGEQREANKDIDYFLQLFGVPNERKTGVFTADLKKKVLWTQDEEGNRFVMHADGELESKIAVSLNVDENEDRPATPTFPDGEFVEERSKFLPVPNNFLPPRLFKLKNDNTGHELLNDVQLRHYFVSRQGDPLTTKVISPGPEGYLQSENITFFREYKPFHNPTKLINVRTPRSVDVHPQTMKKSVHPDEKVYLYRNLTKYLPFDKNKREIMANDLKNYEKWKKEQEKQVNALSIIEMSAEEKEREFDIQQKIMLFLKRT